MFKNRLDQGFKLPTFIAVVSFTLLIVMSIAFRAHAAPSGRGRVMIDGNYYDVNWSDGDSFRITEGRERGQRVRLLGYNTLESYGPVHKWGDWNEWELYRVAKDAKTVAIRETWECTSEGVKDHYQRLLVRCPKLISAMVSEGMGHLFEVEKTPDPTHVALQIEAIKAKRGMWAKGAPSAVMTSLHSMDEDPSKPSYNRVVSTQTGIAKKHLHSDSYTSCQWVCLEGSCLLYVPYQKRYGDDRPECLKWKRK